VDKKKWMILFPNASDALDVGIPDVVHTPHAPRLLILKGSPREEERWKRLCRCPAGGFHETRLPGLRLNKKHVTLLGEIEDTELTLEDSIFDLPVLQQLVQKIQEEEGTEMEPLPCEVFADCCTSRRLQARFKLPNGKLSAELIAPQVGEKIQFEDTFVGKRRGPGIEKIATSVVLKASMSAKGIGICLRNLRGKLVGEFRVDPVNGFIHLLVENAPVTRNGMERCRSSEPHFAYHYVLRPGSEKAVWVLVPESGLKLSGSNDNPQCSPVRDNS
jgi:hypothetical protein